MTTADIPSSAADSDTQDFYNAFPTQKDRNGLDYKHFHSFRAITGSKIQRAHGYTYSERCKCGALMVCEVEYPKSGKSRARARKFWFSRTGKFMKETGDGPDES